MLGSLSGVANRHFIEWTGGVCKWATYTTFEIWRANTERSEVFVQYSVFSVQCSVFSIQCSVFSIQCSVFSFKNDSLNLL